MRSTCRACLLTCNLKEYLDLDWNIEDFEEDLTYVKCFQQCTQLNIQSADGSYVQDEKILTGALVICLRCAEELKNAYRFIRKAQDSDRKLRSQYVIKTEEVEIEKSDNFKWVSVNKEEADVDYDDNCLAELPIVEKLEAVDVHCDYEELQTHSHSEDMLMQSEEENKVEDTVESITQSDSLSEDLAESASNNKEFQPRKTKTSPTAESTKRKSERSRKNAATDTKSEPRRKYVRSRPISVQEHDCEYCDMRLPIKELRLHMRREHQHKPLLCQSCPRTFGDNSTLRQHESIHSKDRKRNFVCDKCGKKFFTYITYKNHMKIHDSDRKAIYHCDTCGKSFLYRGSLVMHKLKHGEPRLKCTVCERPFVRSADLEVHLRKHSGDLPYQCTTCTKAFSQSSSLNRHMRQHEGFRYKCDICGKEFTHQSTLKQHRGAHTVMPFACVMCGRGFAHKYRITRHIRTVHKFKDDADVEERIVRNKTKMNEDKEQTEEES